MLHRVIYRTMVIAAVAITAAALVPVALIGRDMEDVNSDEANSTRVTEIYKNQLHPSIGEFHAPANDMGKAHSTEDLAIKRRGQWI
jgi:hypothetical protein